MVIPDARSMRPKMDAEKSLPSRLRVVATPLGDEAM
jgi:hypothetical protein